MSFVKYLQAVLIKWFGVRCVIVIKEHNKQYKWNFVLNCRIKLNKSIYTFVLSVTLQIVIFEKVIIIQSR